MRAWSCRTPVLRLVLVEQSFADPERCASRSWSPMRGASRGHRRRHHSAGADDRRDREGVIVAASHAGMYDRSGSLRV